ncbi:MAG: Ig-like domain-containing protein, partial [Pseudonocardiaceae bacterium]
MDRNLLCRAGFIAASAVAAIALAAGLTLELNPPGRSTPVTRTSDRVGHAQLASAPQPGPVIQISPVDAEGINPRTPIVVHTGGTLGAVSVVNTVTGALLAGTLSKDARTWTSTEPLGYGSSYRVAVTAIGRRGATASQTGTVATLSPAAQAFTSVIPSPGQSDVGVGQPIVVRFDKDVTDRAAAE